MPAAGGIGSATPKGSTDFARWLRLEWLCARGSARGLKQWCSVMPPIPQRAPAVSCPFGRSSWVSKQISLAYSLCTLSVAIYSLYSKVGKYALDPSTVSLTTALGVEFPWIPCLCLSYWYPCGPSLYSSHSISSQVVFKKDYSRDFTGGPVANTLHSQCRGPGFNP